jgi:hypothetical protein
VVSMTVVVVPGSVTVAVTVGISIVLRIVHPDDADVSSAIRSFSDSFVLLVCWAFQKGSHNDVFTPRDSGPFELELPPPKDAFRELVVAELPAPIVRSESTQDCKLITFFCSVPSSELPDPDPLPAPEDVGAAVVVGAAEPVRVPDPVLPEPVDEPDPEYPLEPEVPEDPELREPDPDPDEPELLDPDDPAPADPEPDPDPDDPEPPDPDDPEPDDPEPEPDAETAVVGAVVVVAGVVAAADCAASAVWVARSVVSVR